MKNHYLTQLFGEPADDSGDLVAQVKQIMNRGKRPVHHKQAGDGERTTQQMIEALARALSMGDADGARSALDELTAYVDDIEQKLADPANAALASRSTKRSGYTLAQQVDDGETPVGKMKRQQAARLKQIRSSCEEIFPGIFARRNRR